ncbi:Head decoration protein [Gammaproteobacteria bacterium]
MPHVSEPTNLGDLLKWEEEQLYSRDQVTVAAGQNLPIGTVMGRVTATGHFKAFDPTAGDGSEQAVGILLGHIDATLIDRDDGLMLARAGILASRYVVWPVGITATQKVTALEQLAKLGVMLRVNA